MFKNLLPLFLAAGLLFFGYQAYDRSKPSAKNQRVYAELKPFIPYKIEKRIGGLSITSSLNDEKEKPPATQVFQRLDQLEKIWGKAHLRLEGEKLLILDSQQKVVKTIILQNSDEKAYIKRFFGLFEEGK
ncbi:MAG: hypothetical protein K0U47_04020 [Epsilonproteobacteria bacterium]|nr:hypothetical protein [Campylobacterota bacterium]